MDELIPVILAFVFGGLIWRTTTGLTRSSLSVATIMAAGLVATLVSGEFYKSWMYLLVDVSEAAAGFAFAVTVEGFARRRKSVSTPPASASRSPWVLVRRKSHDPR
jgi:hypothetical protein